MGRTAGLQPLAAEAFAGLLHRSSPAILHSWEISDGRVRPKANPRSLAVLRRPWTQGPVVTASLGSRGPFRRTPKPVLDQGYALCLNDQSCQNGGWVQLSESASVLGHLGLTAVCRSFAVDLECIVLAKLLATCLCRGSGLSAATACGPKGTRALCFVHGVTFRLTEPFVLRSLCRHP